MYCTSNLVLREWKIKTDFFQIIYFIKHKNMAAEKNHRVTINLKKQFLTVITWNNKRSPKQVVPIIIYDSFLFRQSKKDCSILLSVWVFVGFPDIKRPKKYCLRKENFTFLHINSYFNMQTCIQKWRFKILFLLSPIFVERPKVVLSYVFIAILNWIFTRKDLLT